MRKRLARFALLGAAGSLAASAALGIGLSAPALAAPSGSAVHAAAVTPAGGATHVASPATVSSPQGLLDCPITAAEGEVGTQFGNAPLQVWIVGFQVNPLWYYYTTYWAAYLVYICIL